MKVLSLALVITNGRVSPRERHVTDLSFAGVSESAVRCPTVTVAELFAILTGEQKNDRVPCGSADAPLLLTTVSLMEITFPVPLS